MTVFNKITICLCGCDQHSLPWQLFVIIDFRFAVLSNKCLCTYDTESWTVIENRVFCTIAVINFFVTVVYYKAGVVEFKFKLRHVPNGMVTCEINLFQPSSTSDWKDFISMRGNMTEIISEAYCGSWTFFRVAKIFRNNFSSRNNFISVTDVIACEIKRWNYFKIILLPNVVAWWTALDVFSSVCLFVGLSVNVVTSERLNVGSWYLGVGALHENLGQVRIWGHSPLPGCATPSKCGVLLSHDT